MPRCTLTGGRAGSAWIPEPDPPSGAVAASVGCAVRTAQIGGHSAARRRPVCPLDFVGLLADLPHMRDDSAVRIVRS